MSDGLTPEEPHDAGVPEESPGFSHLEGAHLLAAEAGARLGDAGFTRQQILEWAESYLAIESSGDVDGFLTWIETQEQSG